MVKKAEEKSSTTKRQQPVKHKKIQTAEGWKRSMAKIRKEGAKKAK